MNEVPTGDILGINAAAKHAPEASAKVYLNLSQALLARSRKTTLIQEYMTLDALAEAGKRQEHVKNVNLAAANTMAQLHNGLASLERIIPDESRKTIFSAYDPQAQYDAIVENGLAALSPEQAQTAFQVLERDEKANQVIIELHQIAEQKIQQAAQKKDVATYLKWWNVRGEFSINDLIIFAEYTFGSSDTIPDAAEYARHIDTEETEKARWDTEAKVFNRLGGMLKTMPDDPLRPKVAVVRMPRDADPRGSVRVLVDFPPDTYKAYGGQYYKTDSERQAFYSGADAPACVQDAYYRLYQLTRKEIKPGQFEARPFYVTAYVAEGIEGTPDFPEEAVHFLELSFANSDEVIPKVREEMQAQYSGLVYSQKQAIDSTDLEQVYVGDDGLAHFIIARDERGNPIRQDTIQYSMKSLMSGFSNVKNPPVAKLL